MKWNLIDEDGNTRAILWRTTTGPWKVKFPNGVEPTTYADSGSAIAAAEASVLYQ